MAQGVEFNPEASSTSAEEFEQIAYKYKGNVTRIAEHFKVKRHTIRDYFKRQPNGIELLNKIRHDNTECELDEAEFIMRYSMANYKNNMGYAFRAAEKVLDKKGHLRGWGSEEKIELNEKSLQALLKLNDQLSSQQSERKIADMNNNIESKSE